MDVISAGIWQYPHARAELLGEEWWIIAGASPVQVLPRDIVPDDDYFDADPNSNGALHLDASLHEVFADLRPLVSFSDPAKAAKWLEHHCQQFGIPDLCRDHGLPIWHRGRPVLGSCPYPGAPEDRGLGMQVTAIARLVKFLDALIQMSDHVASRRNPVPPWMVEDVLDEGLLDERYVAIVRAEMARDKRLHMGRTRQLLRLAVDEAMQASWLRATTRWAPQRRPELALVAGTTVGLYVADVLAQIGSNDPDRTTRCSVCGQLVTFQRRPRPGDRIYCRSVECQRHRNRIKQARYRAGRNKP